jgi:hypothetical protein
LSITKFCRAQSQLRILKLFKCELWQFEEKWRFFKAISHLVAADSHCFFITFGVFRHKKVYDDDRGSLCGWASTMPWDFWNVQDFQYSVCIFVQCIFFVSGAFLSTIFEQCSLVDRCFLRSLCESLPTF